MNERTKVIRFVEKNVDGCGSDAEIIILIDTYVPLRHYHKEALEMALSELKKELEDELWDTDSLVEEALTRVFGENAKTKVLLTDLEIMF